MTEPGQAFDGRIAEIRAHLTEVDGFIGLEERAFRSSYEALSATAPAERRHLALELVILVKHCQQQGGEAVLLFTAQACVLLGVLLASQEAARAVLEKEGVLDARARAAASLIGSSWSKEPIRGDVRDSGSLFGLMVDRLKKQ